MSADPSSPPDGGKSRPIIALVIGAVLLLISSVAGFGLFMVAAQKSREAARRLECFRNMRELGKVYHDYHDTMGAFPTEKGPGMENIYCATLVFM